MKKIKDSAGIKVVASIVLAVSLIALIITSILGIILIQENVYSEGGVERLRKQVISDIAYNYDHTAVRNYYEEGILAEDTYTIEKYKKYFSEENCNYSFIIEPIEYKSENANEKFPTLSNYDCNDYMYSNTSQHQINIDSTTKRFIFDITHDELEYVYGIYPGEHYGDFMIGRITGVNNEFKESYEKFMEPIIEDYSDYSEEVHYDDETEQLFVNVVCYDWLLVNVKSFVKSDITAYDDFYTSMPLTFLDEYAENIMPAVLPVFIISIIMAILCIVYLIAAAGHRKGEEGITLNAFDKIPYDILLAVYMCFFFIAVEVSGIFYYRDYMEWSVLLVLIMGALPVLLGTTAARIKSRTLFKNTVIFRAIKWFFSRLKEYCVKTAGFVKYLWKNLNIYWKFLGIFAVIAFFEFVVIAGMQEIGVILFFWFFEKIILGLILVVAVINMNKLKMGAAEIAKGNTDYEVDTDKMLWEFKNHGEKLNSIRSGIQFAVEEQMKSERMKTELITNVSHDIKTPLTSIINYVDLLEKENFDNEKAAEYIEVLDRQSARLKKLIQDLIDASKASTGNIPVELGNNDIRVLLEQALGEFSERLDKKGLKPIVSYMSDNTMAYIDGKLMWRVFDNIINNVVKYAQANTRVYIDVENVNSVRDESEYIKREAMIKVTFKNVSEVELNVSGDELMERFVRGDSSRNTEGSGLGLSIARSLMEIQNGKLEIKVDGDLFKVVLLARA